MNETVKLPRLMSPEQVSDYLGDRPNGMPQLSAFEIRRLARDGKVIHQRGPRNRIQFTEEQAVALVDSMTYQPDPQAIEAHREDPEKIALLGFRTSKRSRPQ